MAWADGSRGWEGLIPEGALPRVFDPPQGLLVAANDRMLGADYPYPIGHDYAHGYRGHRIRTRLSGLSAATEPDMLALQLDTRAAFYDFYRDVAPGCCATSMPPATGRRPARCGGRWNAGTVRRAHGV